MTMQDPSANELLVRRAMEEIAGALPESPRLDPVLQAFLRSALRLVDGDSGSIMLLSSGGRELVVVAAEGPLATYILGNKQDALSSMAGQVVMNRVPLVIKGVDDRSLFPKNLLWSAVVPLMAGSRLLGVINLSSDRNAALAELLTVRIKLLADQAAVLVEKAMRAEPDASF